MSRVVVKVRDAALCLFVLASLTGTAAAEPQDPYADVAAKVDPPSGANDGPKADATGTKVEAKADTKVGEAKTEAKTEAKAETKTEAKIEAKIEVDAVSGVGSVPKSEKPEKPAVVASATHDDTTGAVDEEWWEQQEAQIGAGVGFGLLVLAFMIRGRRRARRRERELANRRTQFGMSAVDPSIAQHNVAAWERVPAIVPMAINPERIDRRSLTPASVEVMPLPAGKPAMPVEQSLRQNGLASAPAMAHKPTPNHAIAISINQAQPSIPPMPSVLQPVPVSSAAMPTIAQPIQPHSMPTIAQPYAASTPNAQQYVQQQHVQQQHAPQQHAQYQQQDAHARYPQHHTQQHHARAQYAQQHAQQHHHAQQALAQPAHPQPHHAMLNPQPSTSSNVPNAQPSTSSNVPTMVPNTSGRPYQGYSTADLVAYGMGSALPQPQAHAARVSATPVAPQQLIASPARWVPSAPAIAKPDASLRRCHAPFLAPSGDQLIPPSAPAQPPRFVSPASRPVVAQLAAHPAQFSPVTNQPSPAVPASPPVSQAGVRRPVYYSPAPASRASRSVPPAAQALAPVVAPAPVSAPPAAYDPRLAQTSHPFAAVPEMSSQPSVALMQPASFAPQAPSQRRARLAEGTPQPPFSEQPFVGLPLAPSAPPAFDASETSHFVPGGPPNSFVLEMTEVTEIDSMPQFARGSQPVEHLEPYRLAALPQPTSQQSTSRAASHDAETRISPMPTSTR